MVHRVLVSLVVYLLGAAGAGASPASPPPDQPMKFEIVRLKGDCGTDCPEWIAAQGRLDSGAPQRLRVLLTRLGDRRLPVLLDSRGGSVDASLEIGRMIRTNKLDVVIGRTLVEPCAPGDGDCRALARRGVALGVPEIRRAVCASACAFLLAGGVKRYVGPLARVGVHEITSVVTERKVLRRYVVQPTSPFAAPERKLVSEKVLASREVKRPADPKVYERVQKYLTAMGVSAEVLTLARTTSRDDILMLPVASLRSTGLATDFQNAEEVLFGEQLTRWLPASMPRDPAIGDGAKWIRCLPRAPAAQCLVLDQKPAS